MTASVIPDDRIDRTGPAADTPHRWPAISMVVPSLNHGRFLGAALDSVLDQHYARLELIVVDGGSTDDTGTVLENYASRLTRWVSEPDDGPASALNGGFAGARGEIFGFLNADDFLLPGSLETVARFFADHAAADVVSGHGYYATPDGALALPAYSDRFDRRRFRHGACVLLQPATFFRRSAFERAGRFRQTGRVCWDMELWAAMAATGASFSTIGAPLAAFRLHDASVTGRRDLRQRRRDDARAVAAEIAGGATARDRLLHYWFRARKFAAHPLRALRQRWYFFRTLRRWSL